MPRRAEAVCSSNVGANNDPDFFDFVFSSKRFPTGGANRGHFRDVRVDALIEQIRGEMDQQKRSAECSEVQKILAEEAPYVNMWFTDVDDLVPPGHEVRTIAAVVAKLDLWAFCEAIQAREGVAGRDATDPELLVALWLYACIRGVGSARELARRCQDSVVFRWLCGGVSVNHGMLSEFRTAHGAALDELLTQVIASLVDQELLMVRAA